MKALTLIPTLACLLLASCSQNPDDIANPHDSKYTTLEVGPDVCVLDTATQLLWQTKSSESGLHSAANTYSWFAPDEANGELDYRGMADGGTCEGSACDTWSYVQAANEAGFCGHNDWRMPSKDEFFSISDLRRAKTRLLALLRRLGYNYDGKTHWTEAHKRYLRQPQAASKPRKARKATAKAPATATAKAGGDPWTRMVALKKEIDIMESKLASKKAEFSKLAGKL